MRGWGWRGFEGFGGGFSASRASCSESVFAGGQRSFAVERASVASSRVLGSLVAGWHAVLSVLHFFGHWVLSLAGVLAAVIAGVALWFNALPFCDVYNVSVERRGGSVKLVCGVKNTGNGPAYRVTLWLLEYGHLTDLLDAEHYVAPLGPGEHYKGPHVLENDDRPFVSAEMSLGGREPAKRDDDSFRMLLRWEAMFWTLWRVLRRGALRQRQDEAPARQSRVSVGADLAQV